jgi:hypothetical protein
MPPIFELGAIADGRDDRRSRLRADAFDRGDALTGLAVVEHLLDLLVEGSDPPVRSRKRS